MLSCTADKVLVVIVVVDDDAFKSGSLNVAKSRDFTLVHESVATIAAAAAIPVVEFLNVYSSSSTSSSELALKTIFRLFSSSSGVGGGMSTNRLYSLL